MRNFDRFQAKITPKITPKTALNPPQDTSQGCRWGFRLTLGIRANGPFPRGDSA